jgi:hypothetical protein
LLLTSEQPESLPETILSRCITVPLSRERAEELTAPQRELLDGVTVLFRERERGIPAVYRLVRVFSGLLQQARERITEVNEAELKGEESHYRQTTESDWLDDREEHYKALTESHYVSRRCGRTWAGISRKTWPSRRRFCGRSGIKAGQNAPFPSPNGPEKPPQ